MFCLNVPWDYIPLPNLHLCDLLIEFSSGLTVATTRITCKNSQTFMYSHSQSSLISWLKMVFPQKTPKTLQDITIMKCKESGPWISAWKAANPFGVRYGQEMSFFKKKRSELFLGLTIWGWRLFVMANRWPWLIQYLLKLQIPCSIYLVPRYIDSETLWIGSRNLEFLTNSLSDSIYAEVWDALV